MKDILNKLDERYGKAYIWVLIFTAITFGKVIIVQTLIDTASMSIWFVAINFFLIFGIYTLALVLPDKLRALGLFLICGLLSIVIFADVVHYRYFHGPISIYSIYSAGQVKSVGDSVKSLIKPRDFIIFIDIVILGLVFWLKKLVIKTNVNNERIVAFVTSILMIFSISYLNSTKVNNNIYTMDQLGLVNYHLHDIAQFLKQDKIEDVNMQNYLNRKNGNKKNIEDLKGLNLEGQYKDTMLGNYLESINYFDRVLGEFIEDLKQEGLYDNSVIAIYGDHFGIEMYDNDIRNQASSFLNKEYNYEDLLNIPLIIHIPGSGVRETVSTAGGQIDFFPTMLNIMGIAPSSDYLMGQDILNTEEGFVAQQNIMNRGSFIDNEKIFEMSSDGKFYNSKAWNLNTGEPVDLELCREGYERALQDISLSNYIADNYQRGEKNVQLAKDQKIIFSDIVNHKSAEAIEYMTKKEIIGGKTDGRFHPDDPIKKAEFLKILLSALDMEVDTNMGGEWWAPYANTATEKNIITGKELRNSSQAEDSISINEAFNWLENALKEINIINLTPQDFLGNISKDLNLDNTEELTRGLAVEILYKIIS